jgi:hypothetical protein
MELNQDVWQIIFELVIFCEITVGKALALSSFGSPCILQVKTAEKPLEKMLQTKKRTSFQGYSANRRLLSKPRN